MKRTIILCLSMLSGFVGFSQFGIKWDETYSFDKCNVFKIEFYAKNNELMRSGNYKTYFQSAGENFDVKMVTNLGNGTETVVDKKNVIGIQIYNAGSPSAYYNAGAYKYPTDADLKRLDLVPKSETKQIAGFTCKKYTYTFKKIFGEVWITDDVKLSNDLGVFRACKMAAKHNTLSVPGFVMEMTTEDSGGGKTLMTTLSLQNNENYTLDLKGVTMNTAINKISYYLYP